MGHILCAGDLELDAAIVSSHTVQTIFAFLLIISQWSEHDFYRMMILPKNLQHGQ